MAKKKKSAIMLKKMQQAFVSILVLAIFLLPVYLTGKWLKVVFFGNEPRKTFTPTEVAKIQPMDNLRPFAEPLVTITFDDGWETVYSEAYEIMAKYGVRSTQYVLGDEFDNIVYMSEAQIRSLQESGHEIASHTMTHPNLAKLDEKDISYEMRESKSVLSEKFGPIRDFATPLGAYDKEVINEAKSTYRSHRNTDADPAVVDEQDVNTKALFNPYNIIAYTVRRTTTDEDIRKLIDYTKQHNGWLVLTYHQIDDSDAHFGVTPEVFERHMKIVTTAQLRLPTMGAVLDALGVKES